MSLVGSLPVHLQGFCGWLIFVRSWIYFFGRPFTQEELDLVLRKIKNRKAAGLDEIPPEVWKTRQFDDILLRHCNAVYNQNPIDRWMKGCILPFPKKGDLGLAKNYRGITLSSIAAKIYNALLRNRIEPKIDNILRKNKKKFLYIYMNIICPFHTCPYLAMVHIYIERERETIHKRIAWS